MKKLTRDQMQTSADQILKAHKVAACFATQDGNIFLRHHDALNHNKYLKKEDDAWDGEIITFNTAAEAAPVTEKTPGESEKEKAEKEQQALEKKRTAAQVKFDKANHAWENAQKALDAKPDDKKLQKAVEKAKEANDKALEELYTIAPELKPAEAPKEGTEGGNPPA